MNININGMFPFLFVYIVDVRSRSGLYGTSWNKNCGAGWNYIFTIEEIKMFIKLDLMVDSGLVFHSVLFYLY